MPRYTQRKPPQQHANNDDPDATPPGAFALAPGGIIERRNPIEWNNQDRLQESGGIPSAADVGNGYLVRGQTNNDETNGTSTSTSSGPAEQDVEQPAPDPSKPDQQRRSRVRVLWVASLLGVVAVVAVCLGLFLPSTNTTANTTDPLTPPPGREYRADLGIEQIVLEQVVLPTAQHGDATALLQPNWTSPYYRALHWLLYLDPRQLEVNPDDGDYDAGVDEVASNMTVLQQRYILAIFYFQTSNTTADGTSTWRACQPPSIEELIQDGPDNDNSNDTHCQLTARDLVQPQQQTTTSRWLSGASECQWAGIQCNPRGVVTTIQLENYGLVGTLPRELAALTRLHTILLGSNPGLRGSIPPLWQSLADLTHLDLSYNQHTGSIFSDDIIPTVNATERRKQDHTQRRFLGRKLRAQQQNTTSSRSSPLQILNLAGNQLSGMLPPAWLRIMPQLQRLELQQNIFQGGIPSDWFNTTSTLQYLDLSSNPGLMNNASSISTTMAHVSASLRHLDLSSVQLGGTIPLELYSLTQLTTLRLADNILTGLLRPDVGNLFHLQNLELQSNHLTGTLPDELGRLSDILTLHIEGNAFSGSVPTSFCDLGQGYPLAAYADVVADCGGENSELNSNSTSIGVLECPRGCCSQCCSTSTGICQMDTNAITGLVVHSP